MESDKLDRGKLVDEFVNEIMSREGNRGRSCRALEIMRVRVLDPPDELALNDEQFSWLICVFKRQFSDFIIPEKCKGCNGNPGAGELGSLSTV